MEDQRGGDLVEFGHYRGSGLSSLRVLCTVAGGRIRPTQAGLVRFGLEQAALVQTRLVQIGAAILTT